MFVVWPVAALIGQEFFKGTFAYCADPGFPRYAYRRGETFSDGSEKVAPCANERWENPPYTYDDFPGSILSTFLLIAGSGYTDLMFSAMAATEANYSPKSGHSEFAFWYFFVVYFCLNIYFAQLFMNLIWGGFLEMRNDAIAATTTDAEVKGYFVTAAEGNARRLLNGVLHDVKRSSVPVSEAPPTPLRLWLEREMTQRGAAGWGLDGVILVNAARDGLPPPERAGLAPRRRRGDVGRRRRRVLRRGPAGALRARVAPCVQINQSTTRVTRPMRFIVAILLIMFMILYVYAGLGRLLYAHYDLPEPRGHYLGFQSPAHALLLLFVCANGDVWPELGLELRADPKPGWNEPLYKFGVYVFFGSFVVIMDFFVLNLFVMIISEAYDSLSEPKIVAAYGGIEDLRRVWGRHDPTGSGRIPRRPSTGCCGT
ncbi:hypothetical protein JL722_9321 [Aureococcus anophagefferens]|nr:hypothetical protein JL722_9321 [Aureococcus anophagefferens]